MQNNCDFFNRQTTDKKLKMLTKILYYKNIFITIYYIVEYIFCISIFNDFSELIGF